MRLLVAGRNVFMVDQETGAFAVIGEAQAWLIHTVIRMDVLAILARISYLNSGLSSKGSSEGGSGVATEGTTRTRNIFFGDFGCLALSIFLARGDGLSLGRLDRILSRFVRIVTAIAKSAKRVGIQYFHLNSDLLSAPVWRPIRTSTSCARPCLPVESVNTTAFSLRSSASIRSNSGKSPMIFFRRSPRRASSRSRTISSRRSSLASNPLQRALSSPFTYQTHNLLADTL